MLAAAVPPAVAQSEGHGQSAQAAVPKTANRPPESKPGQPAPPGWLTDVSAPAAASSSGSFDSSFDARHLADPKASELDSPRLDLTVPANPDVATRPVGGWPSPGLMAGALPGWAWMSLIALVIGGAIVFRKVSSWSAGEAGSGILSSWFTPRCPYCQNAIARASTRRSAFESWVLPVLLIAPVRCLDCRRRYYSLIFFAKSSSVRSS